MAAHTAVVIVNWNGAAFLHDLLVSVFHCEPAEVIVVDNASSDSSREVLSQFPAIQVIWNPDNCGFGSAANQGIERSTSQYVLVMNVDVKISAGAIDVLESCLHVHQDAAVAAPQLTHANGTLQRSLRRFPTIGRIFLYLSYLDRIIPSKYFLTPAEHHVPANVEQPMGAALLFRREALLREGTFDPQFFMYMEEVDLCERLARAGWKILYMPEAQMIHYAGGSSNQAWARTQRYYLESLLRYFRKRCSVSQLRLLRTALGIALFMRGIVNAFAGRLGRSAFYLKQAFILPFAHV